MRHLHNDPLIGSIPEKDPSDGCIYNTSTVYSPKGAISRPLLWTEVLILAPGELVAIHRKVHLFDIDIPGKIKFKVEYIRGLRVILSHPNSGKRDADWWLNQQLFRYRQGIFSRFRFEFASSYLHPEFARVGLGICYDVRFPELAMISARQGK